jgi:hypothetical protein
VFRVLPPRGGSSHGDDFAASLCRATNIQQTPDRLLAELPPGSILALDDLEMWWERGEAGLAVLDQLLELIERHGDRTLFILALGRQAHTLINGFRPLADRALATLECEPLAAEDLKTIIMLRHASTGATFELAGRGEEELSEWRRARLFSAHFDFCGGWVGPALRSWVTHVRSVTGETLAVVAPGRRNSDVLDELRPEWSAILVQLMVHKQLARPRLRRIAGGCDPHLDHHVDGLIRTGMVTESRHDVVEVDPFIHHLLLERFVRRGMLV